MSDSSSAVQCSVLVLRCHIPVHQAWPCLRELAHLYHENPATEFNQGDPKSRNATKVHYNNTLLYTCHNVNCPMSIVQLSDILNVY